MGQLANAEFITNDPTPEGTGTGAKETWIPVSPGMTSLHTVMLAPHQVRDKLRRASSLYVKKSPLILKKR